MVRVLLTRDLENRFLDEPGPLEVEAATMRALIAALEARYPGIAEAIETQTTAVIDGEVIPDALTESLEGIEEVSFIPKLTGG